MVGWMIYCVIYLPNKFIGPFNLCMDSKQATHTCLLKSKGHIVLKAQVLNPHGWSYGANASVKYQ